MATKALLLILTAACACSGLDIELKIKNDPQCQFKGQQCSSDLKRVIYCTAKHGNSYTVITCPEGESCRNEEGEYKCKKPVPDFPDVPPPKENATFTCQGEGLYPDAYQCNIGYLCPSQGKFPDEICECPAGTALIILPSLTCTDDKETMEKCMCPYTDRCKEGMGVGGFDDCHPDAFYVCKPDEGGRLRPEIHKCPPGQSFADGRCQSNKLNREQGLVGNVPVCRPYDPPCFPESDVKCSRKNEMLPHKMIKRCYYYCNEDLKAIVRDCGKGSYFTCKNGQCGCVYDNNP